MDEKGMPLTATDHYLCYGPNRYSERPMWMQCDGDSFFYRKKYSGCCIDPFRADKDNKVIKRGQTVCGDALAQYVNNTLRYKAGMEFGNF